MFTIFLQQCCYFQSEARSTKFTDQADNIGSFRNLFYFPKEQINYLEVNFKLELL